MSFEADDQTAARMQDEQNKLAAAMREATNALETKYIKLGSVGDQMGKLEHQCEEAIKVIDEALSQAKRHYENFELTARQVKAEHKVMLRMAQVSLKIFLEAQETQDKTTTDVVKGKNK